MTTPTIKKALQRIFPIFDQIELVDDLANNAQYLKVPSETRLLEAGAYIKVIPLVLSGSVKVFRQDEEGREALLYYILAGQSCAMTITSCMRREKSTLKAITQEETELLALPSQFLYDLNKQYPSWQNFVYETFNGRFNEVLEALDNVIFHKMDDRLANYLTTKSSTLGARILKISHQEIADDLATSREVISRLLKQFEKRGLLAMQRGQIELVTLQ